METEALPDSDDLSDQPVGSDVVSDTKPERENLKPGR